MILQAAPSLRNGVADLTNQADRDLAGLWARLEDAVAAREPLNDVLPALIDFYGSAAAAFAAEWYDDLRAKVGVGGSFTALAADIPDSGGQALVGWALSEATDYAAFRTLIEGGTQRRIANFARQSVMDSTYADPKSRGWQRVSRGQCHGGFCDMLAGRGAVYSEAGADFASHDHCHCVAVPAFDGEPVPVKPFKPSLKQATDADRARVRDWIASH